MRGVEEIQATLTSIQKLNPPMTNDFSEADSCEEFLPVERVPMDVVADPPPAVPSAQARLAYLMVGMAEGMCPWNN